jgi:hypothetical protein
VVNRTSGKYDSERFRRLLALNSSIFCYLFLVFFQPFGVNNYKVNSPISAELLLGIFPIVPAIFLAIYGSEKFLRPFLTDRFHIKLLGWYAIEFIVVGSLSFLVYNWLGAFHDFRVKSYVFHLLEISSILIFPYGATTFYFKFKNLEKDYQQVLTLTDDRSSLDELLHLSGDYKKDEIALKPKEIVHLVSEDNYVGLNYLEEGVMKKYLIRSSLARMQDLLDSEFFFRCHRSHLINVIHVVSYRKKKNRIWIKLTGNDQEIPVSRTYEKELLDLLKKV